MDHFRTGDVIKQGWQKFKKHFLFVWLVLAILIIVSALFGSLGDAFEEQAFLSFVITIASIVATIILELGMLKLFLDLIDHDTERPYKDILSQKALFWPYLGASILYGFAVVIGLILLIVPGIYVALTYQFFGYLMVDKRLGAVEALKKSAEITKGLKWQLLAFLIAIFGLNLLGALVVLVGLVVTIPVSMLAFATLYRILSKRLETPTHTPELVIVPPVSTETATKEAPPVEAVLVGTPTDQR